MLVERGEPVRRRRGGRPRDSGRVRGEEGSYRRPRAPCRSAAGDRLGKRTRGRIRRSGRFRLGNPREALAARRPPFEHGPFPTRVQPRSLSADPARRSNWGGADRPTLGCPRRRRPLPREAPAAAIEEINAAEPDLVLVAGDLTDEGYPDQYPQAKKELPACLARCLSGAGKPRRP